MFKGYLAQFSYREFISSNKLKDVMFFRWKLNCELRERKLKRNEILRIHVENGTFFESYWGHFCNSQTQKLSCTLSHNACGSSLIRVSDPLPIIYICNNLWIIPNGSDSCSKKINKYFINIAYKLWIKVTIFIKKNYNCFL